MKHATKTPTRLIAALATVLLLALSPLAFATDADSDGLDAAFEAAIGTSDTDADSDDDNLSDYDELYEYGTSPLLADTDGDGTADDSDAQPLLLPSGYGGGTNSAPFTGGQTGSPEAPSGETPKDGVGVNVTSGEFVYTAGAGGTKGIGLPMLMRLLYRSQSGYDGALGPNWFWIGEMTLTISGSTGTMRWVDNTLRSMTYYSGPDHWTFDDAGMLGVMIEDSGTYILTMPSGLEFHFTSDVIDKIQDRFGNALDFSYTAGQLTSVTDTRGESHTVTYYTTGRVKDVTYADGRKWTFIYNVNDQLHRIEGPATTSFTNGITQEFRYIGATGSSSLNDNMLVAFDGNGNAWMINHYDTSDRVERQEVGNGDFTFDYTNIGSQKTAVEDRAGNDRDWEWHSTKLTRTKLTQYSNRDVRTGDPTSWVTEWTHDSDGYLLTVEKPRGNGTKYTLNAAKLPTEIRQKTDMDNADSSTADLITTIAYDSTKYYGRTSVTDPRGNETTFALNSYGQPTTITYPDSTHVSPSQEISETLTYNSNGTLASRTDGEGKKTSYTYFTTPAAKKGRVSTVKVDDGGLNLSTSYDYTDWGDVKEVTDPEGDVTSYTVEAYGNVTQITYPTSLGYITKLTQDFNLNLTKREVKNIDHDGTTQTTPVSWWTTEYTYSEMDEVTAVSDSWSTVTVRPGHAGRAQPRPRG